MRKALVTMGRSLGLALSVFVGAVPGFAADGARVFPVRGVFFDAGLDSKLDPIFREKIKQLSVATLAQRVHEGLTHSFKSRVGPLNDSTAGNTFAVSFHVTRATSFSVDKGNGNSDVVAAVTGGIYFTNVASGEILTTISRSVVSRAVADNKVNLVTEKSQLFGQTLDALIVDLVEEAAKQFNPIVVEAKLVDRVGGLLVFDAGYNKGFQEGDQIEDSVGNLIRIVYSAETYAVGMAVIPASLSLGAVFQKFLPHPADGKDRPRVAVLIDTPPTGFAKDYIARLFSEILGNAAPLTVVQVNTGFSQLLSAVRQQEGVNLSSLKSSNRRPPNLLVRLRIAEPIAYQAGTNLDFEKVRRYETQAFADVIDTTGKISVSVMAKDVIEDKITRNIGPGIEERREVNVKNALTELSQQLSKLIEIKREHAEVVISTGTEYQVNGKGIVYADRQKGLILRKFKAKFGNENRFILIPVTEADVEGSSSNSQARVKQLLPLDATNDKVSVGDVFETQRLGVPPKSARSFFVCGPSESLGNTITPALMELTRAALGQKMPGMYYAPEVAKLAEDVIGLGSGFSGAIQWSFPQIDVCIQPVERVDVSEEKCSTQCERSIVSRYTLRIKSGANILARFGFEGQFKSTGYYKSTEANQLKRMLDVDLTNEAKTLLEKAADKANFSSIN